MTIVTPKNAVEVVLDRKTKSLRFRFYETTVQKVLFSTDGVFTPNREVVMPIAATGRSRILPVPYYVQPTGITCQSTCLKMFASYLEQHVVMQSTGAGTKDIEAIWTDINKGTERPVQLRNAHANLKWWLQKHFTSLHFEYLVLTNPAIVTERLVFFLDSGMPVLMSISHARVPGHIVLVVGYENYLPNQSAADFRLVVHDPYGSFDPWLLSNLFGGQRWEGGSSLIGGGQLGPGSSTRVPLSAVSRQRSGDAQRGTFYLLSARR